MSQWSIGHSWGALLLLWDNNRGIAAEVAGASLASPSPTRCPCPPGLAVVLTVPSRQVTHGPQHAGAHL